MGAFAKEEKVFAKAVSEIAFSNPFLPVRIEHEHEALGDEFVKVDITWNKRPDLEGDHPNVKKISQQVEALAENWRMLLEAGKEADEEEVQLYEDLILFMLYHRYRMPLDALITEENEGQAPPPRIPFYKSFAADAKRFFHLSTGRLAPQYEYAHLFAGFFQIRRAFHHIFNYLVGESMATAQLRASVWQSIFTHDMRRYWRALYQRMQDITTLITGPSGTGKELVARAIGFSRYISFNPRTESFTENYAAVFHGVNLSALSPTLIESELFGHRRGAFTGALEENKGWFESCSANGVVFLDEIGELDPVIQIKLLRVLQTRVFQRLGETKERRFLGKIIAATNRDLAGELRAGRFREDLYYRLCSDMIVTPSLYEQLRGSPVALGYLVSFIVKNLVGDEEAPELIEEVLEWIDKNLGPDYAWPGNVREVEQCVRNIMIHQQYHSMPAQACGVREELAKKMLGGSLTADELLSAYCTLVYAQTGSYQETARRLQLDHRTVKSKIDPQLLADYSPEK